MTDVFTYIKNIYGSIGYLIKIFTISLVWYEHLLHQYLFVFDINFHFVRAVINLNM